MSTLESDILLASEVVPPPETDGQVASMLAREHQEQAGAVASGHGGRVLLRVGRGCVSRFGDLDGALAALWELLSEPMGEGGPRTRLRLCLHRGALNRERVPMADPLVVEVRQLLSQAGPGEILLTEGLHQLLRDRGLQTMPLPVQRDPGVNHGEPGPSPAAHRLLGRPPRAADAAPSSLSGWYLGAAVAVAALAMVGALLATFLFQ